MKRFADLYADLDATTSTLGKVAAMRRYFATAPPEDAAWAVYFLSGRRPKRLVKTTDLRAWAQEEAGIPQWLFEESYVAVGDLAETVSLLLDRPAPSEGGDAEDAEAGGAGKKEEEREAADDAPSALSDLPLSRWLEEEILPLRNLDGEAQRPRVTAWWRALPQPQTFLLNKLLTGGFRVGVSRNLVARAVAEEAGLPPAVVAHRLMGRWRPTGEFFIRLLSQEGGDVDLSRPYPFFLASPLQAGEVEEIAGALGPAGDWLAEWKWDGIRSQVIRRGGTVFLWSRGEELVTERFPELAEAAKLLPDGTVIDGEIVAWADGGPLPFATLQTRIGRKKVSDKLLREAPVCLLAYDLMEVGGDDLRQRPLSHRRERLAELVADPPGFLLSTAVEADGWPELAALRDEARQRRVEGLMLKRLDSPYRAGRKRGDWWKWKVDPFTIDAVMIYAQAGHGRRANLFTDYTFAVWRGDDLVPVAKAYSGLDDAEIRRLDHWIRRHTRERFGPVRSVEPHHVFEIAFEGIRASNRHKSGLALRFPRIARWREDKEPAEADRLETLHELLDAHG